MQFNFDNDANTLYVALHEGPIAQTIEITDMVYVDIDASGAPLGIEFVSANEFVPFLRRMRGDGISPKEIPMAVEPNIETISLTEIEKRLDSIVDRVARREARIILENNGVPVAGIVSIQDVQRLERLDRERAESFKAIEAFAAGFADQSAEEIEREVAKAIAEVRAANRLKAASGE